MSPALALVIERLSTDAAFRALVERDPRAALAEYALDPAEWEALASGDRQALQPLGVDARIAKFGSAQTNTTEQDAAIEWLQQWWH
jgi:putative modified peptide